MGLTTRDSSSPHELSERTLVGPTTRDRSLRHERFDERGCSRGTLFRHIIPKNRFAMPTLRISSWTPQKSESAESNKSSDSESEPDLESSKKKPPKKKPRLEKKDLKPYESIIQKAVEETSRKSIFVPKGTPTEVLREIDRRRKAQSLKGEKSSGEDNTLHESVEEEEGVEDTLVVEKEPSEGLKQDIQKEKGN